MLPSGGGAHLSFNAEAGGSLGVPSSRTARAVTEKPCLKKWLCLFPGEIRTLSGLSSTTQCRIDTGT